MTDNTTTETGKTLAELAKDIVATPEAEPQPNNGELLAANNLRIVHIRANPVRGTPDMTVAFRVPHRNSRTMEIATAVVHPKDYFARKVGTRTAIEAFLAGRTVRIPVVTDTRLAGPSGPVETILYCFGE